MKKKINFKVVLTTAILSCAVTTAVLMYFMTWRLGGRDSIDAVLKYADVQSIISNEYIGDLDPQLTDYYVYNGMVEALNDRWSYYMNAEEYERYEQYTLNQYMGIGVTISTDHDTGLQRIMTVTPDSPAHAAGVLVNQLMVKIDDIELTDMSTDEVRNLIRESYGDAFTLTLQNEDGSQVELEISSEIIYSEPVTGELLDGGVGYIKIKNFEENCAYEFEQTVNGLIDEGAKGFVFDLRSNPGGQVRQLVKMLDLLLPEGDLFIMSNNKKVETVETSDDYCIDMPMTVLVNSDSYSAAEFFAAALSEYDWAKVVGEQTTGKGRAQITIPLSDGSAVHISSDVYLTPKRVDLSEAGGITPDFPVELDEEKRLQFSYGTLGYEDDPQLIEAVNQLKLQNR